jgi:hypothetical protein
MREQVKNLKSINRQLNEVLIYLQEANSEGKQLDYVSHPNQDYEIDALISTVQQIQRIWYQEGK